MKTVIKTIPAEYRSDIKLPKEVAYIAVNKLNHRVKMKYTLTAILLVSFLISCNNHQLTDSGDIPEKINLPGSQTGLSAQKDSLIYNLMEMKAGKLDCSAEAYWKIIQQGEKMIPLLLECLTVTRPTTIYNDCKKGKLNVGEVCYFALEELADFPAFLITQTQYDLIENDCWNFYTYLFNDKNKNEYQRKARNFYTSNRKINYQYKKFSKKEMTPCRKLYKIEGRLVWNG
jgi:hypothetical protein